MADDTLARLLAGAFRDPDDGQPLVAPMRTVVIEDSLAGREADLVEALDLGRRLAVVSDPTTHRVMGRRIEQALGRGRAGPEHRAARRIPRPTSRRSTGCATPRSMPMR